MSLQSSGGFRSRSKKAKAQQAQSKKQSQQQSKSQKAHDNSPNQGRQETSREPEMSIRRYTPGGDPRDLANVDIARALAYDVVLRVDTQGAYANLVLPRSLREHRIKRRDAAFATELTYGTLRVRGVLDAVISACSSRPIAEIHPEVLNAIRLGAYQLLYTRVEPHAAVDSAVTIVNSTGHPRATGFANAILRKISRSTPQKWLSRLEPQGEIASVAFRHAHPEWIATSFAQTLGLDELEAALAADSERPEVHLVARPGEITAEELALMVEGDVGKYSPYAVKLPGGDPGRLEPVREGLAAVQDEGSQLIARAVAEATIDGPDGGRWLDLCAGPGGKAALLGCLARIDGAHVDAVEIQPHRAELIRKATEGLPVTIHTADGRALDFEPNYDRVLVDAPCSGLGALRRRPEARWRKQESDIDDLTTLQFELLKAAVDLTRTGGIVIYSTCSPDLRETREIVDAAVSELPVEELEAATLVPGMDNTGTEKSVQMWPHRHGTDAMFFAVLKKTEPQDTSV